MIQLLTISSDALSQAAGAAVGSVVLVIAFAWGIGMLFLMPTVAVITWVVKRVWFSDSYRHENQRRKKIQKQQKEWQEFRDRQAWEEHIRQKTGMTQEEWDKLK